jgi:polysaccharide export outer membrane protein
MAVLLALGMALIPGSAQTANAPPPELLQYIRETKRQGYADAKIKSQAVAVGWPAAAVDNALTYLRNEESSQAAAPAAGGPGTPATAPKQGGAAAPQAAAARPAPANQEPLAKVPDDYVIGPGDTLQINVWKDADASVPVAVVRPDGKITVPMVKDVEVAGLTPTQAEASITSKLKQFISEPNVTVVVATIIAKKVYVLGAVRKEGPLPYAPGMTVMQALSEAGGLTDFAKRKKIYVLRPDNGQTYRLDFNYDNVVKGESMEQNIPLLPGDTVVIPH